MDVVFCCDQSYYTHLCACIDSLLRHNKKQNFRVHLIFSDLNERSLEVVRLLVEGCGAEFVSHYLEPDKFATFPTHSHFKKENYYRLFIERLVDAKRVLYLDADLIVCSSIRELFETDFGGNIVACVEDPCFEYWDKLGISREKRYFNSGVMLLNLDEWRRNNITDAVLEFIENHPEKISFADQCALNLILQDRWKILHPRFNAQTAMFEPEFEPKTALCSKLEFKAAVEEPSIVHFTGGVKPWHVDSSHPYRFLYRHHRSLIGLGKGMGIDWNLKSLIRLVKKNT